MNRDDAREWVKNNGPLPEPPTIEGRACEHKGNAERLCSCHLTVEQVGVAQGLGTYALYIFGVRYFGRHKVPFYPSSSGDADAEATPASPDDRPRRAKGIAAPTGHAKSVAGPGPAKSDYDRLWRAAKAQGPDALTKFKAEWKLRNKTKGVAA